MASVLKGLSIFKSLTDKQLDGVEELFHRIELPAGHVLFNQGDQADAFYVIKEGAVKILLHEAGETTELNTLKDGDFFGEIGLIENTVRMADAVLEKDSVLLAIRKDEFQRFMAMNPSVAMKILTIMAKRYKAKTDDSVKSREGECIGVFSATGGVGNSLISANLAVALHDLTKKDVLLLDLDLMFGDQAGIFNVENTRSIAELNGETEIDYQMLDELITRTKSGIGLLQAPPRPEESELVTTDLVKVLLELAQTKWDYVIFDTANSIQDLAITLLEVIDKGFYVLTPEFLSVKNAHRWLHVVELINIPTHSIELILNKDTSGDSSFHDEIEKQLKKKFFATLPYDYEAARKSLNTAKLLVRDFPDSGLSRELRTMAAKLAGVEPGPQQEKSIWQRILGS